MKLMKLEMLIAALICFIVICSIALLSLKGCGGVDFEYSNGSRTGKLYKLSKKGVFWKTYEGELDLEMMETNENGMSNKIWHFSVTDEKVAKELEQNLGKRITLHYSQPLMMGWDEGSSGYLIESWQLVD